MFYKDVNGLQRTSKNILEECSQCWDTEVTDINKLFFGKFSHNWDLSENLKEMEAKHRKIFNCNRIQHLYYLCLSKS